MITSLTQESDGTREGSPLCLRGPGNIAVGAPMTQVLEEKTVVCSSGNSIRKGKRSKGTGSGPLGAL